MFQSFWDMFYDFKVAQEYYRLYSLHTANMRRFISAVCLLASSAFLVSWVQSSEKQLLWAILIFISQVIVVLQPVFPYSERNQAACYIYEDLTDLLREIEATWRTFSQETEESEFLEYIDEYQARYDAIEKRFAKSDLFPSRPHLHKKAEKEANNYFRRFEQNG